MTREEKLRLLSEWDVRHSALDEHWSALYNLLGAATDSHLGDAVWVMFDKYTSVLGRLIGARDELHWFWLENMMGERGHIAGVDEDLREINTLEDLLWLIEVTQ